MVYLFFINVLPCRVGGMPVGGVGSGEQTSFYINYKNDNIMSFILIVFKAGVAIQNVRF